MKDVQLGCRMGPLTIGAGAVSCFCALLLDSLPLPGLPGWTSVEEEVFSPAGTRCPRVVWYSKMVSSSLRRKRGGNGGWDFQGWGREEKIKGNWNGVVM